MHQAPQLARPRVPAQADAVPAPAPVDPFHPGLLAFAVYLLVVLAAHLYPHLPADPMLRGCYLAAGAAAIAYATARCGRVRP